MNKLLLSFSIIMIFASSLAAQSAQLHIPPCQDRSGKHDKSICFGYAIARAFGHGWNASVCPAKNLFLDYASLEPYFKKSSFSYSSVKKGDIIEFGNSHVAYVSIKGSNYWSLKVDQVENKGSTSEDTYIPLYYVINGNNPENSDNYNEDYPNLIDRGEPTGFWRKKEFLPIIVENKFSGGEGGGYVKVSNKTKSSPHSCNIFWCKSVGICQVEDGNEHYGYVQLFHNWKENEDFISSSKNTVYIQRTDYRDDLTYNYVAHFKKEFNITFKNNYVNVGNKGKMKIMGTTYTLPHSAFPVKENNTITARAVYSVYNGIGYSFALV